jgi:hypothetical protein
MEISNHKKIGEKDVPYHAQTRDHAAPEQDIVEDGTVANPWAALDQDYRHLQHHGKETVSTEFASDAPHNQLMCYTRHQEGDECGYGTGHRVARCRVDMATEEMMDRDVPFARELKPVQTVPPVRVELPVGKAWEMLGDAS